jgi:hypothetical protein
VEFIVLTLDGAKRAINVDEIAALEDEGEQTIIYLKGNSSVHIACDQDFDDVLDMVDRDADDE